ncbi:HAD family hydrolase [Sphingobacterium sp. DN00404]|uniref:HAD family hydrolase n=1 Tax=Sphingobacterium micropteri TaxID=2763501 RepID=A0ABR7YRI6_9SPHI|nr:HAD family hydrolase [Sphingobacterium micropteri]MBD1433877.1 HAD family hydrolase [Sphingobacterium micropteri]
MMNNGTHAFNKSVYVFEIDDVLYPKPEYLLQVYYLFSNFAEYTEGLPIAKDMVGFMKETLETIGEDEVLPKTIAYFGLHEGYRENFERLKANAHLPLKLILKEDIKRLLLSLFEKEKHVGILTDGNPIEQLNKLKHIDWQDLSRFLPSLKVFFIRELMFRNINPIDFLKEEYQVSADEISIVTGDELEF